MADTEKPELPPTPTRVQLARDIASKLGVKCWHFIEGPEIRRICDDRQVTARVIELERAGLADRGKPDPDVDFPWTYVSLTPAGEEWLQTHGGNNP